MSRVIENEEWPYWAYETKREWKKDVRKRWVAYRKALEALRHGCVYYPVSLKIRDFEEQDEIMKKWFKNV